MGTKYILGNWKMNGTRAEATALGIKIAGCAIPRDTEVAIFPPFTALEAAAKAIHGSKIALGAQDVSPEANGPFTGDISAGLLKGSGCRYVIIGHSERRA